MNGPSGPRLRLVEDVLGEDARDIPTLEEVRALWAEARKQPVPDYKRLTRLVIRGGA